MNQINNALEKYNNRVHGKTKMTPFEASNKTEGERWRASQNNYTAKLAATLSATLSSHTEGESARESWRESWRALYKLPNFQVGE